MDIDVQRNLTLAIPLVAVGIVVALRSSGDLAPLTRKQVASAALITAYVWVGVLAVEAATDWWAFTPGPTTFLDMPVETSLGWALAWGALPVLGGGRVLAWVLPLTMIDLLAMPRLDALVSLGPRWWLGEALLVAVVLLPALIWGRATRHRRRLGLRVVLQMTTFSALVGWVAPTAVFTYDGSWQNVVDHPYPVRATLLAAAVIVAVPALSAVLELARSGHGTPWPWDPPDRLVTTGPYAYLANPMQAGGCALLIVLALASGSLVLLALAGSAVVFSIVLAERHEETTLTSRWSDYADYRRQVPTWIPRRRPYLAATSDLWVSRDCGLCRTVGQGIERMGPVGLQIRPAEEAGVPLTRMRWVGAHTHDRGVAAFARALEHVGLAHAWLGWLLRLPGVTLMVQTVADSCGMGPRALTVEPPTAAQEGQR